VLQVAAAAVVVAVVASAVLAALYSLGAARGAPPDPATRASEAARGVPGPRSTKAGADAPATHEHLLKASLLIALYSVRSERRFCERLGYDLLFKWFLNLNVADQPFDASTFSKNRERLLDE
jgi:hypothetical protein